MTHAEINNAVVNDYNATERIPDLLEWAKGIAHKYYTQGVQDTRAALVEPVRNMRQAQREYFRTRRDEPLHKAQALEREVDAIIDDIDLGQKLI